MCYNTVFRVLHYRPPKYSVHGSPLSGTHIQCAGFSIIWHPYTVCRVLHYLAPIYSVHGSPLSGTTPIYGVQGSQLSSRIYNEQDGQFPQCFTNVYMGKHVGSPHLHLMYKPNKFSVYQINISNFLCVHDS